MQCVLLPLGESWRRVNYQLGPLHPSAAGTDVPPRRAVLQQYDSFKWMGCAIVFVACVGVAPLYFPMWGGLFCGPQPGVSEEDYYYAEYSPAEREQGMHLAASNFVRPLPICSLTGVCT